MCRTAVQVLVVGGGVVGLLSAIGMAKRGFPVTVLDSGQLDAKKISKSARVYAINAASKTFLEKLGIWDAIDAAATPYQNMYIWDAKNHANMQFEARDLAAASLGFIVEEFALKCALLEAADALPITKVSHAKVSLCKETATGLSVTTEAGDIWDAKFAMIADGANSKIRDLLAVPMTSWAYHHDALVATVRTEKSHQNTAYQVFHDDGPLAFLPLKDKNLCSIVWSHPKARIDKLMALDKSQFETELARAFSDKLGRVALVGERFSFPLRMRHVNYYAGDAWMLLGDAAHTIHPLAGLGLNVGLADLKAWLDLLDKKEEQKVFSPRMLKAYQRERKHAVWQVILLMQGIKTVFGMSAAPVQMIRGFGMQWLNQTKPLKRILMRYAAGVDNET